MYLSLKKFDELVSAYRCSYTLNISEFFYSNIFHFHDSIVESTIDA